MIFTISSLVKLCKYSTLLVAFCSATVPTEKSVNAAPVAMPRPNAGPSVPFEPTRSAPPRPQPMPRTKSAFDVSGDDLSLMPAKAMPRNQSETNLQQRPNSIPNLTDSNVTNNMSGLQQPASPVRCPSLSSLNGPDAFETDYEAAEPYDTDFDSMPPPQNLPPSLPTGYGRGPPPPVPGTRPVGSLPAPLPPARPGLMTDAMAAPLPGPRSETVIQPFDEVLNQQPSNGDATGVQAEDVSVETPYIPPRPKAAPVGLPPSLPPVIPARTVPPPIPSRTPVGVPQIPPRQ